MSKKRKLKDITIEDLGDLIEDVNNDSHSKKEESDFLDFIPEDDYRDLDSVY